jgi:hypothetical protein
MHFRLRVSHWFCSCSYANLYIAVGLPLGPFSDDMKQFLEQLELYRQDQCIAMMMCFHQLSLNLTGQSNTYLSGFRPNDDGDALQLETFCRRFFGQENVVSDQGATFDNLKFATLLLAYIFQDVDELQAWLILNKPGKGIIATSHFMRMYSAFFTGLSAFTIYRQTRKRVFYRKAVSIVRYLKSLSKHAGINVVPLHRLLLAEKSSLTHNDSRSTIRCFDEAIVTFARCGLIHLEAIACERAGDFTAARGDIYWAKIYYEQSIDRYKEWGASAKAILLTSQAAGGEPEQDAERKEFVKMSLRGKRRYDPNTWNTIEKVDLVVHSSGHRKKVE